MKSLDQITKVWETVKSNAVAVGEQLREQIQNINGKKTLHDMTSVELESHREIDLPEDTWTEDGQIIYAIGDIHGRYDLLDRMLKAIIEDCEAAEDDAPKPKVVFLGDYVDRGFQSRKVIQRLIDLEDQDLFETICLKGNHEDVFAAFLRDASIGAQWSNFGGRETLISYGVTPPLSVQAKDEWNRAQEDLLKLIPDTHVAFLKNLETSYQHGPFGFVHAGIKSGVPFEKQKDSDKLWIRQEFLNAPSREDLFIIHGHTPVDLPYADHRRINIDTGAYYSGRLTAVKIEAKTAVFLTL